MTLARLSSKRNYKIIGCMSPPKVMNTPKSGIFGDEVDYFLPLNKNIPWKCICVYFIQTERPEVFKTTNYTKN